MKPDQHLNSQWRRTASTIYRKPVDSKIFGAVEVDVTDLEAYIAGKRKAGLKITLTHFFILTLARALKQAIPELNVFPRRGKIIARTSIDAMVSILQANGDMSSVKIDNADRLTYSTLAEVLTQKIAETRQGSELSVGKGKNLLGTLPWPFNRWLYSIYKTIVIDWGIAFPAIGFDPNSFGSFVITSIGSLGLDTGYPALLPSSNVSFVFVMGGIQKKPVVINDQIVIRRMMNLSIVLDHRLVDASHGARLLKFIKQQLKKPEELDLALSV